MALSPSHFSTISFLNSPKKQSIPKTIIQIQIKPKPKPISKFTPLITFAGKHRLIIPKATKETTSEAENQEEPTNEIGEGDKEKKITENVESKLGAEIQKAMKERGEKEEGFLSGVIEEIREIEWPVFNKVLGTTGVVLGVIAGSSVVLLTVNAVLAELSDRVFAGKGVQDFFS